MHWWRSSSSAGEPSERFTAKPKAKPAQPPGRWTTCGAKWRVTPGVAATGNLDAVHRVIGRPGVIFVGEGSAARVKPLLAQEKKRTARLVGDVPIYDIIVGNGDGEVPLAKLERHLTRLPANITVKQMDTVESRLAALGSRAGAGVMPKGPLPTTAKMRSVQRTVRRK